MRMKNSDVVSVFINGGSDAMNHSKNLRIVDNKLVNYSTTIAEREGNTIILNGDKYSQTTTVIQNMIRREARNIIEVNNIDMGYDRSIKNLVKVEG